MAAPSVPCQANDLDLAVGELSSETEGRGAASLSLLLSGTSAAGADRLSRAASSKGSEARRLLGDAIVQARRQRHRKDLAAALLLAGLRSRAEGDLLSARAALVEACRLHERHNHTLGVVECLEGIAGLAANADPSVALLLFGCAAAVRQAQAIARLEQTAHLVPCDIAAAFGSLPVAAAFRALADGASLPVERAVSIACQEGIAPLDNLTAAEAAVASLVAEGLTNAEIGRRLGVSPRTVQAHVSHALAKTGVSTRTALARELNRHRPVAQGSER
jgi:DNA-binding CsgD family transcriptional regulator